MEYVARFINAMVARAEFELNEINRDRDSLKDPVHRRESFKALKKAQARYWKWRNVAIAIQEAINA